MRLSPNDDAFDVCAAMAVLFLWSPSARGAGHRACDHVRAARGIAHGAGRDGDSRCARAERPRAGRADRTRDPAGVRNWPRCKARNAVASDIGAGAWTARRSPSASGARCPARDAHGRLSDADLGRGRRRRALRAHRRSVRRTPPRCASRCSCRRPIPISTVRFAGAARRRAGVRPVPAQRHGAGHRALRPILVAGARRRRRDRSSSTPHRRRRVTGADAHAAARIAHQVVGNGELARAVAPRRSREIGQAQSCNIDVACVTPTERCTNASEGGGAACCSSATTAAISTCAPAR